MQEASWIPIGRGAKRAELEDIIAELKKRWEERYDYRIEEGEKASEELPFRLYLKHL